MVENIFLTGIYSKVLLKDNEITFRHKFPQKISLNGTDLNEISRQRGEIQEAVEDNKQSGFRQRFHCSLRYKRDIDQHTDFTPKTKTSPQQVTIVLPTT